MSGKYLDDSGLLYFWGKLQNYFQAKLVSGTNIKTINNNSLLGSGNITIQGGGDHVELTQAQYDALSQAEKENGTVYFIIDGAKQKQSDWNQTDTSAVDYIKNKPTIQSLKYEDITATTGSSKTDGWYSTTKTITSRNTVALQITHTDYNTATIIQFQDDTHLVVRTAVASRPVQIRRWYI